jgi:hypothetical protein
MYFFHYTSKKSLETMTLNANWNCEARQPQKGAWFADQHEVGFYVTPLSPEQLTSEKARKTGGGGKFGDYVLVFDLDVTAKKIGGIGSPVTVGEGIRLKLVGHPLKFALTPFGADPEGKPVPFTAEMCAWCGATDECPAQFANDETVLESLYRK